MPSHLLRIFPLAVALMAWFAGTAAAATPRPPNILFICIDDLNDWVGFVRGHPQTRTPHKDRLGARGVIFANAHCAAPRGGASRAAGFCGRVPVS
jgi:arylsulfatase A-like enzyme